ncbi:MAG: hypothetical protein V2J26_12740 [Pacificimonas sp.]|jgi:hypothetical protein|nr:hypothetical protein [Pacificimonas sp.]
MIEIAGIAVALALGLVHVAGSWLTFLDRLPRSRWLSFAGGTSVAYVFVHLLPELSHFQREVSETLDPSVLPTVDLHVWLMALLGLAAFYSVEQAIRARQAKTEGKPGAATFWLHLGIFALYNTNIGYLLVESEERGLSELLLYGLTMALHLLVVDAALRADHGHLYRVRGRWLLAVAPLAGALFGSVYAVGDLFIVALVAFLGGSVILNVLKEELPEERESSWPAFAAGIAGYTGLLLAAA